MTREEAIKHLKDIRSDMWTVDSEVDAINMAITALEQPEQKKGMWRYHEPVDVFECSVCGRQMVRNIFDYCPWCGAKMEGVQT